MRRSRLQFLQLETFCGKKVREEKKILQQMADWNLRSCNGMLVKSGWVVCWQPKGHNHNTSIWNIICSKHRSVFTQTVGSYWDRSVSISKRLKYFNAVVSSVACFGSEHRAIYNSQLATLDVHFRKLWRSIVGPPSEVDWNAAWNGILIYGMNGLEVLLQMPASTHGLTSLAKITGISQNMLPVCLRIGGFNVCSRGILSALDV